MKQILKSYAVPIVFAIMSQLCFEIDFTFWGLICVVIALGTLGWAWLANWKRFQNFCVWYESTEDADGKLAKVKRNRY